MRADMIWVYLFITMVMSYEMTLPASLEAADAHNAQAGNVYTNDRFGFSVRYPEQWRRGNPLPDGIGMTLYPPIENSLVALSGHMNLLEGTSQDRRQTLDEFAAAHRRIITDLYSKKHIEIAWQQDQTTTLAGFPAKRLAFTYRDDQHHAMLELHIFSLGRNEGRGVRIKMPVSAQDQLMPAITRMLETYQPGRDQNAVSPLAPKPDAPKTAPHS
jgi:hypothetical protein